MTKPHQEWTGLRTRKGGVSSSLFLRSGRSFLLLWLLSLRSFPVFAQVGTQVFTDETGFLGAVRALGCVWVGESFEEAIPWAQIRTTPASGVHATNELRAGGITWAARNATGEITTSLAAARSWRWGIHSNPFGTNGVGDGFRMGFAVQGNAVGGWFKGTPGAEIVFVLDGEPVGDSPSRVLDTNWQFAGVIAPAGFRTCVISEVRGAVGNAKEVFGDDFILGSIIRPPLIGLIPASTGVVCTLVTTWPCAPGKLQVTSALLPAQWQTWQTIPPVETPATNVFLFTNGWPAAFFRASAGSAPRLTGYPCQTTVAGLPYQGQEPVLARGDPDVTFSLLGAPDGMTLQANGRPTWSNPVVGRHEMSIRITNDFGADQVQWVLRVVTNSLSEPHIMAGRHVDYVVPANIAAWINQWDAMGFVDGIWEHIHRVIGQEPLNDRQIVLYDPNGGGGAGNGNPITAGPAWWNTDPVKGWVLGAFDHEVAHNFNAATRAEVFTTDNWARAYFHNFTEFSQVSIRARALADPAAFGLSGNALVNYRGYDQQCRDKQANKTADYLQWLRDGGNAETYAQQPGSTCYNVWAHICILLQDLYGPTVLEDTLRAFRYDGVPDQILDLADSPLKKNTLLFCILSYSAGQDLRTFFGSWGFALDDTFFEQISPAVSQSVATLAPLPVRGWTQNPANGHWYRMMRWKTKAEEAERVASRLGGWLLTLRSREEEDWILQTFGNRGTYWLGLTDRAAEGVWTWGSGEPVTYTNWKAGSPAVNVQRNYAVGYWFRKDQWYDATADQSDFSVIVERVTPWLDVP